MRLVESYDFIKQRNELFIFLLFLIFNNFSFESIMIASEYKFSYFRNSETSFCNISVEFYVLGIWSQ